MRGSGILCPVSVSRCAELSDVETLPSVVVTGCCAL